MYFLVRNNILPAFHSCGKIVSAKPFIHANRMNANYLLLIGMENTLHLDVDGQKIDLGERDALLIPPYTEHFGTQPSANLSFFWCHFLLQEPPLQLDMEGANKRMYHVGESTADDCMLFPTQLTMKNVSRIVVFCQQMLDYVAQDGASSRSILNYLLGALLNELSYQASPFYAYADDDGKSLRISQILEWVRINAYRNITVSEIARRFNYNPNYLSNLFKEKTGTSMKHYINKVRIDLAKEYLLMTDLPLRMIAQRLSYNDEKYFMRLFKEYENMTPTEFRNAYPKTVYTYHSGLLPSSARRVRLEAMQARAEKKAGRGKDAASGDVPQKEK